MSFSKIVKKGTGAPTSAAHSLSRNNSSIDKNGGMNDDDNLVVYEDDYEQFTPTAKLDENISPVEVCVDVNVQI